MLCTPYEVKVLSLQDSSGPPAAPLSAIPRRARVVLLAPLRSTGGGVAVGGRGGILDRLGSKGVVSGVEPGRPRRRRLCACACMATWLSLDCSGCSCTQGPWAMHAHVLGGQFSYVSLARSS